MADVPIIEVTVTTDDGNEITIQEGGVWESTYSDSWTKSITIEAPSIGDNISLFFTEYAISITKIASVVLGGGGQSVSWTLKYGSDRSGAGTEVVTGGLTTTSITSGDVVTTFDNSDISMDNNVWMEISNITGTVNSININLLYTIT